MFLRLLDANVDNIYNVLIDLDSIHNKPSSDYSLNICFLRRFLTHG